MCITETFPLTQEYPLTRVRPTIGFCIWDIASCHSNETLPTSYKEFGQGVHQVFLQCRSSKLTHMLKNALGGNSKTTFIANLWNDVEQRQETVSTCRFAQRIAQLQTHVSGYVASIDHTATIRIYEKDIQELQSQLAEFQRNTSVGSSSAKDRAQMQDNVQQQVPDILCMHLGRPPQWNLK